MPTDSIASSTPLPGTHTHTLPESKLDKNTKQTSLFHLLLYSSLYLSLSIPVNEVVKERKKKGKEGGFKEKLVQLRAKVKGTLCLPCGLLCWRHV